jgi:hypothetical protein
MKDKSYSYSKIAIIVIAIMVSFTFVKHKYWNDDGKIIAWDVISYYAYLPATFIYHDPGLSFMDGYHGEHKFVFWPETAPNGKKVIKTSMGLSFLYMPFFFVGHLVALITDYDAGGYSAPYKFFLQFGSLFYVLIGLFFLRKVLLHYFTEEVTAMSLLLVFFATNLHYYTAYEPTMSHAYNFSLFAVFIWLTIKWHEQPTVKHTLFVGLLSGLIVLVRPTNILILLFFMLWDVKTVKEFNSRILLFLKKFDKVLLMAFMAFLVWLPQFLYWKMQTGSFLYFSYGDERFFFNDPQIINGLFSYRKGWLLYTPVMLFALTGIFFMKDKQKSFFLPILLFTVLNVYVILSWWAWWYGGSFGLRAFIDSYALLVFPLAAIISYFYKKKKGRIAVWFIAFIFLFHGIFQTFQYYHGAIHWDSMTKAAYWDSFGHLRPTGEYWDKLKAPDYEKAKQGERGVE